MPQNLPVSSGNRIYYQFQTEDFEGPPDGLKEIDRWLTWRYEQRINKDGKP
jgi:hypothetical protein